MRKKFNINLDQEFYIILNDYGRIGRAFVELDLEDTGKDNLFERLAEASNPVAVIYFNPVEGHSRDVSEDIAREWIERLAQDPDIDESGFWPEMRIPAFIKKHLPDYEAYAAEVMDDYRLNQQSPERLYGCPARI